MHSLEKRSCRSPKLDSVVTGVQLLPCRAAFKLVEYGTVVAVDFDDHCFPATCGYPTAEP